MEVLNSGLMICAPYTRPFYGAFIDSFVGSKWPSPMEWKRIPFMGVDDSRNALTQHFKDSPSKPQFMLFTDSDATWSTNAIIRLMAYDLPVVCATMYTRKLPPTPTIGFYEGRKTDGTPLYAFMPSLRKVLSLVDKFGIKDNTPNALELPYDDDTLQEIDGCGMHFTMIRRDVIEKVKPPWFLMGHKTGAGEDFYFCKKAKDAGFPLYWDTGLHTGHLLGEDADFGIRELIAFSTYVDRDVGFIDPGKLTEV